MSEMRPIIERHLAAIFSNDIDAYHASTVPELSLYEWHVTPHRIDGWPFHDFMLSEVARDDTAGIALDPHPTDFPTENKARLHFELANYREQVYGDAAICCYTLLISRGTEAGVRVLSYNESRVLIQHPDGWKVVHVHKSPSWKAPFQPPEL
ncbi:MAG: protein kinase [Anaerolineales bacterium]|nr:MAG: protein kinase [Anaerolineales bacterium]